MEYEDRLSITTPEGLSLDLVLAGLGSRVVAGSIDLVLKLLLVAAVLALVAGGDAIAGGAIDVFDGGGAVVAGVLALGFFLVTFFYDVLFETLSDGRTPGKRLISLRVVHGEGHPVGLRTSLIRNILRLIDGPGTGYMVGILAILLTPRHRRLGDLAAGTYVIREPRAVAVAPAPAPVLPYGDPAEHWDLSALRQEDLLAVRQFLERRESLTPDARAHLALQLSTGLMPRIGGAGEEVASERFLERLLAAKAGRDRVAAGPETIR